MFSGEPGEGAFDHGPLLAVDGVEFVGFGLGSCGGEQVVLGVQADDPSGFGGGAEVPTGQVRQCPANRAAPVGVMATVMFSVQVTVTAAVSMVKSSRVNPPSTAGRGGCGLITGCMSPFWRWARNLPAEYPLSTSISVPAGSSAIKPAATMVSPSLPGPMSHAVINPVSGSAATWPRSRRGKPDGFVSMARFGINGGDHRSFATRCAIRHWPGRSPGSTSWPAKSADTTQPRRPASRSTPRRCRRGLRPPTPLVRVINKLRHEPVPIGRVIEIAWRTSPVSRLCSRTRTSPSSEMSLRTRRICAVSIVIVSWRATASSSTVESNAPTMLAGQHVRFGDHRTHRVEDPRRPLRAAEFAAPQHQHCRVERLIGQRQTRRCFPANVRFELPDRFSIRQALQRLEHHHCRDHISRHRRTAPLRREQISEHVIRKQTSLGAQPKTRAPIPPAPNAHTTPPHPTTHDQEQTNPASPQYFRSQPETRAPTPRNCSAVS